MPAPKLLKPRRRGELAAVQKLMASAVMRPLTADDESQTKWTDGTPTKRVAEGFIKPNDRLTSFERIQIYNQQYWWRLRGNFADDFRGLRAVLGDRKFDKLTEAYLQHYPSTSWTLRNLGSKLEQFIREHPEYISPRQAAAIDMVRVEWARVEAFDGLELPVLDPQKIARTPPDRLFIRLQPYLTLLELRYPIDQMLRQLKEPTIETDSMSNAVTAAPSRKRTTLPARLARQPVYLAVHRVDCSVYYKRLEPEAYRLLVALRDGASLQDACNQVFQLTKIPIEQAAAQVQEWFATWMQFGWLCKRTSASR